MAPVFGNVFVGFNVDRKVPCSYFGLLLDLTESRTSQVLHARVSAKALGQSQTRALAARCITRLVFQSTSLQDCGQAKPPEVTPEAKGGSVEFFVGGVVCSSVVVVLNTGVLPRLNGKNLRVVTFEWKKGREHITKKWDYGFVNTTQGELNPKVGAIL